MIFHLDSIEMQSFTELDREDLGRFLKLHDIDLDELIIEDIDIDVVIDEITVKHFLKTHDGRAAYANGGLVRETFTSPLLYELPVCLSRFSRQLRWVVPAISTPVHAEEITEAVYTMPEITASVGAQPITITVAFDGGGEEATWVTDNGDVARVTSGSRRAVVSFGDAGSCQLVLTAGRVMVRAQVTVAVVTD